MHLRLMRLGATWIDADYIQQFMEETFETPYYLRRSIEVKFSELTAEWHQRRILRTTTMWRHM